MNYPPPQAAALQRTRMAKTSWNESDLRPSET